VEVLQDDVEFPVAAARHRQNEFQCAAIGQLQGLDGLHVIEREQPPVGHDHQAPNMGEAPNTTGNKKPGIQWNPMRRLGMGFRRKPLFPR